MYIYICIYIYMRGSRCADSLMSHTNTYTNICTYTCICVAPGAHIVLCLIYIYIYINRRGSGRADSLVQNRRQPPWLRGDWRGAGARADSRARQRLPAHQHELRGKFHPRKGWSLHAARERVCGALRHHVYLVCWQQRPSAHDSWSARRHLLGAH